MDENSAELGGFLLYFGEVEAFLSDGIDICAQWLRCWTVIYG